ncbi:MAG: hypothetical protein P3W96_001260, partial [Halomonas sp.]
MAGEGAATGAELDVGHGTVWVNGDNGYIAMQVSGLEVLPGAGLTDSGINKKATDQLEKQQKTRSEATSINRFNAEKGAFDVTLLPHSPLKVIVIYVAQNPVPGVPR